MCARGPRTWCVLRVLAKLGEAKIAEADLVAGVVEDIVGLYVAVDDAARVQVCKRRKKLPHDAPPLRLLQRPRRHLLLQRARAVLHLDVEHVHQGALHHAAHRLLLTAARPTAAPPTAADFSCCGHRQCTDFCMQRLQRHEWEHSILL